MSASDSQPTPSNDVIDVYIATFPPDVQVTLNELRGHIRRAVPDAVESITYQIPTFKRNGRQVICFAGWAKHIAVYPVPDVDDDLQAQLAPFRSGRGTLRFPLGRPIPYELVEQIVKLLVAQRT